MTDQSPSPPRRPAWTVWLVAAAAVLAALWIGGMIWGEIRRASWLESERANYFENQKWEPFPNSSPDKAQPEKSEFTGREVIADGPITGPQRAAIRKFCTGGPARGFSVKLVDDEYLFTFSNPRVSARVARGPCWPR